MLTALFVQDIENAEGYMALIEKIKSVSEEIHSIAEAIGKSLWVFFAAFAAIAIVTGHPALLGAIRDRLVLAGVTSLKTPFGDIDTKQIGQLDSTSRILGINAARASELADNARDAETKKQLELIAKDLGEQEHIQLETLSSVAMKQKSTASPGTTNTGSDVEGWLYLGRRSGEKWRPPSFSIGESSYPVRDGDTVVVKNNALLYDEVDCKVIDSGDFKATMPSQSPTFVKSSPIALRLLGVVTECSSVGDAKTIWAKVRVPAASLLRAGQ